MTLQITQSPPEVSLAHNPVLFGIRTNNHYLHAGVKAQFTLHFSGFPAIGQKFTLSYNGMNHEFEFVSSLTNSPGHLPASYSGVGFGTFVLYLTQVLTELNRHYHLSKDFDISIQGFPSNPFIFFQAKQPGERFTIELSSQGGVVSTNPTGNVAGVDAEPRLFYKIYVQCWINGSLQAECLEDTQESGDLYFDISAFLRSFGKPSFVWPATALMVNRTDLLNRFYIRYGEYYGLPAVVHKLKATPNNTYSLPGGVGFFQSAHYEKMNTSWYSSLQYSKGFLSWQPQVKYIKPDQIEKLFFLNYLQVSTLRLHALITFYPDGSNPLATTLAHLTDVQTSKYCIVEITFGYDLANIASIDPSRKVHRIDLFLTDPASNQVSETKSYLMDYSTEIHSHDLIWRNSFGMYDTDRLLGKYEKSVYTEKQIFSMTNKYRFMATEPQTQVISSSQVEIVNASSGWIEDQEKANWLRELLLSPEVYEVIAGTLYPIVITSADVSIYSEGKTLHNISIDFTRAYTDEHFSKGGFVTATFIQSFNQGFSINPQPVIIID